MFSSSPVRVALSLFALAPLAAAGILTVGPAGSGAQFTEIQAAIDAALADDVILVQPGTYGRILVTKPLRILGVAPGVVVDGGTDNPAVVASGIAAGQELVLSGFRALAAPSSALPPTIRLENSPGTIVLSDVLVRYDPGPVLFSTTLVGVDVEGCARVLVSGSRFIEAGLAGHSQTGAAVMARQSELWIANCEIRGSYVASGGNGAFPGAKGIDAEHSTLRVWRSRIVAGDTEGRNPGFASGGVAGISARHSKVQLFGGPTSMIGGGDGAFGEEASGPGGPGVALRENSTARIQQDIPISGGMNGNGGLAPAVSIDASSSFTLDPKVYPTLGSNAAQVVLGAPFALTIEGTPGSVRILFLSLRTYPTPTIPPRFGLLVLDRTQMFTIAGEVLPPATPSAGGGRSVGYVPQVVNLVVPSTTSLIGSTLFFQSAERAGSSFAVTNPVLVTITG